MIINKRPLSFQPLLNNPNKDSATPPLLTPEILLRGYEVPSIVVAPHLFNNNLTENKDMEWLPINEKTDHQNLFKRYENFRKVKVRLNELY